MRIRKLLRVRFVVDPFIEQEKIMAELTPMMQKYMETKEQYKDCILFIVWEISMKCFSTMRWWLPRNWRSH